MDKQGLHKKIYARIEELPMLPVVVPRLLSLANNPQSSAGEMIGIIAHDPALTSKLLKVANSAYYGFPQKISDIELAVALLGYNQLKALVLSIGVIKNFPYRKQAENFSESGLWVHSLSVATVMQDMGRRFYRRDSSHDYLFIIGLLHDLGKIVLDQFFPDLFNEALERANASEHVKLHQAEWEIIGIDHSEVAAMLLTRWKFPPKIVQPVAGHHRVEGLAGESREDVALLRIASVIAQESGLGEDGNAAPSSMHPDDMEIIGVAEDDVAAMKTGLQAKREEIESFIAALA